MDKTNELRYWIHTITPLHVGAGRGLGYIDLPITREKVTNWPCIPGSSVKGVIADHFGASDEDTRNKEENRLMKTAFGVTSGGSPAAGALAFTDARLLCLPVRSFYGTFAWITSPFCLKRFKRDEDKGIALPGADKMPGTGRVVVSENSALAGGKENNKVYLEDLNLDAEKSGAVTALAGEIANRLFKEDVAWQEEFSKRFAIVDDEVFTFLCESGTSVDPHVRIDGKTGIVANGALWYEETLPVETILTGRVLCDRPGKQQELFDAYCPTSLNLQMGGKASTGKGLVRCVFERTEG